MTVALRGLFLNTPRANCSIHESRRMAHDCLKASARFSLDYTEIDGGSLDPFRGYDFYIFNYHLEITHAYLDKPTLIGWCVRNTLNCFLYDRNMPGLAATTDQAVASGRPLAVSANQTFRHVRARFEEVLEARSPRLRQQVTAA